MTKAEREIEKQRIEWAYELLDLQYYDPDKMRMNKQQRQKYNDRIMQRAASVPRESKYLKARIAFVYAIVDNRPESAQELYWDARADYEAEKMQRQIVKRLLLTEKEMAKMVETWLESIDGGLTELEMLNEISYDHPPMTKV